MWRIVLYSCIRAVETARSYAKRVARVNIIVTVQGLDKFWSGEALPVGVDGFGEKGKQMAVLLSAGSAHG